MRPAILWLSLRDGQRYGRAFQLVADKARQMKYSWCSWRAIFPKVRALDLRCIGSLNSDGEAYSFLPLVDVVAVSVSILSSAHRFVEIRSA